MRKIIIGAIALALGCATTGQQEQKSQALSAQDQAHQSLQAAADAQKRAVDEQKKAEAAQKDVEDAQRALADAQAKLRGQRVKAQQAQADARRLSEEAHQDWFRAPNARERRIAAGLFIGFGLFFVALFVVLSGWWFRWVILLLAGYSMLSGIRHLRGT